MEFDYTKQPGLKLWDRDLVKNARPLVSVVTPYYNGGEYIEQTYKCVMNQTFPWFEWIIVDDGSTKQKDLEILEDIEGRDPRIRVVHKENGGISSARNAGIREMKTDYFLSLDCDDLIEPTYIEYCYWMLEKNPEASWAYTYSVGFQDLEYLWDKQYDPDLLKTYNHLTEVAFFRKSELDAVGGYSEVYKNYYEDWYLYIRQAARGAFPVQSCGDYLEWYRRRGDGVLAEVNKKDSKDGYSRKLVAEQAKKYKKGTPGIFYPNKEKISDYERPILSDFNYKSYTKHDKTRVLLITAWLEMGGADKFNLDLLSGMDKDKFDVSVITTVPSENPWQQKFREITPEVYNLPNFLDSKDYAEFISYFIKTREIDSLLVTNSYYGYYLIPWLRENFPELEIIDYVHMEEWYWRAGGYARASAAMAGITEKTYVCNSSTKKVLVESFGRDSKSVDTLYIGADSDWFNAENVEPGICKKTLGISEDRPIVLYICRIHPQKRPLLMLKIAEELKKRIPNVAFVVVGDGPMLGDFRIAVKYNNLNGTIYFAGSQEDVRPYYKDAAATLICSIKEGLALTAYESCSMGVPVVSANVGGQADLIDESVGALIECRQSEADDFNKIAFPQEEILDYADKLEQIIKDKDLRAKMSENARAKIESGFSTKHMVDRFESEVCTMLSDKEMVSARAEKSEMLKALSPLAADCFVKEMVLQTKEDYWDERSRKIFNSRKLFQFLRKIVNKLCPLGTKRRELVRRIVRREGK